MKIGLQIPDFTWPGGAPKIGPTLATIAKTADDAGFASIGVMDHFFQIERIGPPEHEMLEAYTTLGFLAAHTRRARLMTFVTGVHYRHPGILAKTVTTLDVLSGGRAWLGIGAGWNEQESRGLGVPFPPLKERFEMLEETGEAASSAADGHYAFDDLRHSPAPVQKHLPIMIGGSGEKKTLRLVARFGDACNLWPTPEIPRKLEILRAHCQEAGRDYDTIEKTAMFHFDVGEHGEHVDAIIGRLHWLAGMGIQTVIGGVRGAGNIKPLEIIGERVIPAVANLEPQASPAH